MSFKQVVVSFALVSPLAGCSFGDRYPAIVIEDDLACRISIDSSVVLSDNLELLGGGLGLNYARNSRGEVIGGAYGVPRVGVWDSTGRLIASFGSAGEGPGELGDGTVLTFVTPEDSVFIRDSHMHWVVYSPGFEFVRNADTGPVVGIESSHTVFLGDGRIATTMHTSPDTSFSVMIASRDGAVLERLGPPHSLPMLNHRPIAFDGSGFWVAPPPGPAQGYVLEHWDGSGSIDREIRRDVPWFRPDPSYVDANLNPSHGTRIRRGFPFPTVDQVKTDHRGRLWVLSTIPTGSDVASRYRVVSADSAAAIERTELVRVLEVFDADSGRILASVQMPFYPIVSFFQGTPMTGFRVEDDPGMGYRVVVMRFDMYGADAGASSLCSAGVGREE